MKSRSKLVLAIALALGSTPALALQLGEIRVKSSLDEPLVAEIPIQLDNLGEAKDLRVGLASPADFTKAGLTRNGLEYLRFSIASDSTGHKLVLVTSEQPVGDPYLDFLIEVDSDRGKQLREYTVLLDPVIGNPPPEQEAVAAAMAPQTAAPVQTPAPAPKPSTPAPSAATPSAPAQQPAPAQATPPVSRPSAATRSNGYTVQRGDTLYRIANETRPDDGVSVDQMMLALQSSNPDAFYRPNINNLKSGAILRIPTRDEIDSEPSGTRARAQVRRQYEDWRGTAARNATTVAGNEAPAASAASTKTAASEGDKLALVPPNQGGGSASTRPGEKGGTGTAEVTGLKQQLATAKESLASARQENNELQSRVKDLEDISGKNQKLLGLKDAQIADLQNKLAQMQKDAGTPAATSAPTPAPAGSATSPVASTATAAAANAAASAASSAAPLAAGSAASTVVAPTAPAARPVTGGEPSQATPQKTASAAQEEAPWYQRPVVWIIGAIVIVALILLGLLRRRTKPLPDLEEGPDAPSLADQFGESPLPRREDTAMDDLHDADVPHTTTAERVQPDAEHEVQAGPVFNEPAPAAETDHDIAFDEPPPPPIAGPDEITRKHDVAVPGRDAEPEPLPRAEAVPPADDEATREHAPEFSDDPVDTKLDLARAYLDMGDPAGARAMLEEVLNEGSQPQKEEAKRLLESGA